MKKILIINGHHTYPSSEGTLTKSIIQKMKENFNTKGFEIKETNVEKGYDIEEEVEKHTWADIVILQSPVNWMTVTWSTKKYMDEVYSAGMMGAFAEGDGRSSKNPKENYGTSGKLNGSQYMLSLTLNAPKEAFDNPKEYLFAGKSLDDLFFPIHMNFKMFKMEKIPTFACYDVIKNPDVENDFKRLEEHLNKHFQ